MREGMEEQPSLPTKASSTLASGTVQGQEQGQGQGQQQALGNEDSACWLQLFSPTPQVKHLHLVLQVETKVLRKTNSRKRHSREGEERRRHNVENLVFLSPTTLSSPKWHSRQGQTGSKYAWGERLDHVCCWEL